MRSKKSKKQRYVTQYYEKVMEPIWEERWRNYLKKVKKLKKGLKTLGPVPQFEVRPAKTVKYFVNLINLVTNFADSNSSICVPDDKREIVLQFNDLITSIVARDEIMVMYFNKSNLGEPVTYDNLYVGRFSDIAPEKITASTLTRTIRGETKKVDVELTPISDWLNNRAFSVNGHIGYLNPKKLATVDKLLTDNLLKAIDEVLS